MRAQIRIEQIARNRTRCGGGRSQGIVWSCSGLKTFIGRSGTIYPPGKDCRTSSQPQSLLAFPPHSALATRTYAMLASCLQGVRSGHHKALGHHSSERSHGKPSTKTRSIVAKIRCALAARVICICRFVYSGQKVVRRITGLSLLPASSSGISAVCAPAGRVREKRDSASVHEG